MVSTRYRVVYFKRDDDDMSKLCGVVSAHTDTTGCVAFTTLLLTLDPMVTTGNFSFFGPMTMNEKNKHETRDL